MSEIEEIKAEIARLQARLRKLESPIDRNIIETVAGTNSLAKAAAALEIGSVSKVRTFLEGTDVPHLYGESWCVACRRHLAGEFPRDTYTYPDAWLEDPKKISEFVLKYGFKPTADKLLKIGKEKAYFPEKTKTIANVLGRFLQVNGYDIEGVFTGVPEWM